jgi:hypothetical protein
MSGASRQAAPPETGRSEPAAPSGRLLLRMPRSLHGALTEAAEREGTSLNQFITGTLASSIGWSGEDGSARKRPSVETRSSRVLVTLLVANAVAVGIAALGAVGILLLAWLG